MCRLEQLGVVCVFSTYLLCGFVPQFLQMLLTLLSNKCSFLRGSSLSSSSFLVPVNFICSL